MTVGGPENCGETGGSIEGLAGVLPGDFMDMKALEDRSELPAIADECPTDGKASLLLNRQRCRHVLHDRYGTIKI